MTRKHRCVKDFQTLRVREQSPQTRLCQEQGDGDPSKILLRPIFFYALRCVSLSSKGKNDRANNESSHLRCMTGLQTIITRSNNIFITVYKSLVFDHPVMTTGFFPLLSILSGKTLTGKPRLKAHLGLQKLMVPIWAQVNSEYLMAL